MAILQYRYTCSRHELISRYDLCRGRYPVRHRSLARPVRRGRPPSNACNPRRQTQHEWDVNFHAPKLKVLISIEVHRHYCTTWPVHATPIIASNGSECGYNPAGPDVKICETLQLRIGRIG